MLMPRSSLASLLSGGVLPWEHKGRQGNTREREHKGTQGSTREHKGKGTQGSTREHKGKGAQGNTREHKGTQGKGNTRERKGKGTQGSAREREHKGAQGNTITCDTTNMKINNAKNTTLVCVWHNYAACASMISRMNNANTQHLYVCGTIMLHVHQ